MATINLNNGIKRLVIVGNSHVTKDYADLIDSADMVVRFNNLNNYGQRTGTKMTHWVLSSNKFLLEKQINSADTSLENSGLNIPQMINSCKELFFSIPPFLPMKNNSKAAYQKVMRDDREERIAAVHKFLEHFKSEQHPYRIITFPTTYITSLADHLWPPYWTCPSNGYLITRMLLDDLTYYRYEKYLIGFSFEGWDGHPWMFEQLFIEKLAREGAVQFYN